MAVKQPKPHAHSIKILETIGTTVIVSMDYTTLEEIIEDKEMRDNKEVLVKRYNTSSKSGISSMTI